MATIAQNILNGRLSVGLSANYGSKASLFSGPVIKTAAPQHIMMVTDALEWMDDGGNFTSAEEIAVANYLVWLMGMFGLQASSITGSGGSVTPIIPGTTSPSRLDFVVSVSSPIVTGSTSASLSQYQGVEINFIRNGIPQSQVTSESSYITWTKATSALVISPALQEGELISIIPS